MNALLHLDSDDDVYTINYTKYNLRMMMYNVYNTRISFCSSLWVTAAWKYIPRVNMRCQFLTGTNIIEEDGYYNEVYSLIYYHSSENGKEHVG